VCKNLNIIVYTKVLYLVYTNLHTISVVKEALTKIQKADTKHTIYLKKDLVNDSAFPFRPKEPLVIRIEGQRLVIERISKDSDQI